MTTSSLEPIERSRLLCERAILDGYADAVAPADRELDAVEADLDLAHDRALHGRYLEQSAAVPDKWGSPFVHEQRAAGIAGLDHEAPASARRWRRFKRLVAIGGGSMVAAALLATILTAGRHISGGASGKLGPATQAGTVTGVIAACPGALQYPQRLASVGGMVLVMRGRGGSAVVAKERVQPGKGFSFRLAPGRYVLTAHKKIGRAIPTVVVIRSGLTVRKMIGAECA